MSEITIYSNGWCPFCRRAKMLLEHKNTEFTEIDVERLPGARQEMIERTKRTSVPQIFIGDYHVGGCDELFALEHQDKLDSLLKG
ncbi:glutaredoxin 3 [Aliamphritea ceti]|uniref:glutaredoxin 3 n=1 Tax=Aliamphritea ceti TaxID=1524258 RepID=UPI0021C3438D|nr:glutaredoxin 3 [Aliamphritea ceti]